MSGDRGSPTTSPATSRATSPKTLLKPGAELDGEDPDFARLRDLAWNLDDTHRLLGRTFHKRMTTLGLTRAQWRLITYVVRHDGLTQTQLADMVEMDKAPLGRMLDRLEEGGWIVRKADPSDRRAKRVHATDKIDPLLPVARDAARAAISRMLSGLSRAEEDQLADFLIRMKAALSDAETGEST